MNPKDVLLATPNFNQLLPPALLGCRHLLPTSKPQGYHSRLSSPSLLKALEGHHLKAALTLPSEDPRSASLTEVGKWLSLFWGFQSWQESIKPWVTSGLLVLGSVSCCVD